MSSLMRCTLILLQVASLQESEARLSKEQRAANRQIAELTEQEIAMRLELKKTRELSHSE